MLLPSWKKSDNSNIEDKKIRRVESVDIFYVKQRIDIKTSRKKTMHNVSDQTIRSLMLGSH